MDTADGKKKREREREKKKNPDQEFVAAKKTTIDVKSGVLLWNSSLYFSTVHM